jgi:hypothetical protein
MKETLSVLALSELDVVAGGVDVVSGPVGTYVDNGSSCSAPASGGGSDAGGIPALNASTGLRG